MRSCRISPVRKRGRELLGGVLFQPLDEPHHVNDHWLMGADANGRDTLCRFDLEVNAATIELGYLRSRDAVGTGPGQFVSSYAVIGKTAGRKTVFGAPMLLQHGRASYQLPMDVDVGVASWGDFSRTTLDPEDDKTFWTIQQVAVDTTHWATQITALHIEH